MSARAAPTRMAIRCRSRASRSRTAPTPAESRGPSSTARSRCRSSATSRSRRLTSTTAAFRTCTRWWSSTGAAATGATLPAEHRRRFRHRLHGEGLIPVRGPNKGTNAAGTLNPLTITDPTNIDRHRRVPEGADRRAGAVRPGPVRPSRAVDPGRPQAGRPESRQPGGRHRLPPARGRRVRLQPRLGLCVPNAGDLFADGMQARIGGPPAPAP